MLLHDVCVSSCSVTGIVNWHASNCDCWFSIGFGSICGASLELLLSEKVETSVHAPIVEVDVAISSWINNNFNLFHRHHID